MTDSLMQQIALSIAETCAVLSLGRTKVYELIKDGSLATFKIGRRTLVRADSVNALAGIESTA